MKCEICNKEYDGYFCPNCAWEEENVLDEKYLEIYLNKKQKHKEVFKEVEYYHNFFDSFITKFNEFNKDKEENRPFYLKLLDDMLEIMEDKKYYFQLLVIKILFLNKMEKDYKNEIKEAEELLKNNEISEEDKKIFENLKAKL